MFFINIERLLLVIIIQGVPETYDSQGTLRGQLPIFAFANQYSEIVLCCSVPLTVAGFLGHPVYYTIHWIV